MNSAPASEQGESSGLAGNGPGARSKPERSPAGVIFTGLGGAAAGRTLLAANAVHSGVTDEITAAQINFLTGFHAALLACAGVAAVGI